MLPLIDRLEHVGSRNPPPTRHSSAAMTRLPPPRQIHTVSISPLLVRAGANIAMNSNIIRLSNIILASSSHHPLLM